MSDDKPDTPKKPARKNPRTKPVPVVEPAETKAADAKPKPKPKPAGTQPTEVLPPAAAAADSAAVTAPVATAEPEVVVVPAPRRKRRIWPFVLGGIVLLLAILLTIAYFVGEAYAKDYARDQIKERIVAVLGVEDPSTVTVDIGSGSVLFQALAGRLNQVDVTADQVTFGTLSGAATVHAESVPLDANAKTGKLDVTFAVPEEQVVSALTANLSGLPLESVTLEEPDIVVTSTLDLFFFKLPVGMSIAPSAEEGQIVFTPTSIKLGDTDYTPDELRQELGTLADPLLAQQSVCVNESLPVALTIVDVDVVAKDLVLKINGDGVVMGGPDLSTPGTCEG